MNVLFVGNSYTFYGDVPGQVSAFAEADPGARSIQTDRVVRGGANLEAHVQETGALKRVAEPQWTHVVLQEKSTGPLHDAPDYHRYVRELGRQVKGQVLLYETWARQDGHEIYRWGWSGKSPSAMRRKLRAEFDLAARDLDAQVVPVGSAWERCLERYPGMILHDTDMHHANVLGSHLAASVFYAWLTGRDPAAVELTVEGVDERQAQRLRTVAVDVVRLERARA
ncbi:MAG TPA: hypothetical protein ENK57_25155 [Polyangiaceae bacterium]|nr:hypothetical protein [Polyangiaceae bacterium]